ncbi:MAG: hypothetical protein AABY64_12085 [Bdellovibrionota bacterium]
MTNPSNEKKISKVAVVGNIAGGKTLLACHLAKIHNLPLTHVDAIQFLPGLKMRPNQESAKLLKDIERGNSWLIEGYGPLDLIEARFHSADRVVFIDLPLWQHFWWLTKRLIKNIFTQRAELPQNCNEAGFVHMLRLYKSIWRMHRKMRPELLRIFARENLKNKVVVVRNAKEWRHLSLTGFISNSL